MVSSDQTRFIQVGTTRLRVKSGLLSKVAAAGGKPVVVLFHGFSFSINDWERTGTLDLLNSHGYSYLAIDLPRGKSSQSDKLRKTSLPEAARVVEKALEQELGPQSKMVIIGPSMGGSFALEVASDKRDEIVGLVLISPAVEEVSSKKMEEIQAPILLIWGERDNVFPVESHGIQLKNSLQHAKLIIIKGAGHAAYLDKPQEFHDLLFDFLEEVSS